jgi:hypothetical protein
MTNQTDMALIILMMVQFTKVFFQEQKLGYCNFYKIYIIKIIFKGYWKNGTRYGNGTLYGDDGSKIYEGEWVDDKQKGYGTTYYPDGSVYKGFFKYLLLHIFLFCLMSINVKGYWKNGMRYGNGTLYGDDGSKIYEGEWVEDKQKGYGTSYFPDGSVYKGFLNIYF